ncbi:hypothetical protein TSUD_335420 [Trifolium subterraneum]|uniref:Uncharacterized protein n=1 Tax=Trifolium subterraneum TaxID=3900 RepID=A0A2Z6MLZ9_TRISU|nr:hypothetical protein TSUD_335420 [Trifolium subterraneum]
MSIKEREGLTRRLSTSSKEGSKPAEIHSSYHLGVNRAYGTATERVYFPGSLPHTTGIEEVVLSSFKETRLTRSTNIKSGGNFYVFA